MCEHARQLVWQCAGVCARGVCPLDLWSVLCVAPMHPHDMVRGQPGLQVFLGDGAQGVRRRQGRLTVDEFLEERRLHGRCCAAHEAKLRTRTDP
jgi:hypothetical protein